MATPQQIAQIRYQAGAPADPASDAIWAQRIAAGTHTLAEASRRIRTERGDLSEAIRRQNPNYGRDHLGEYLDANPGTPGSPIQLPIDRNVLGGGGGRPEPTAEERARQQRQATQDAMRAMLGWLPQSLLDAYINEWINHGDGELAWAKVRTLPAYDQHFPGIKRDDGSLRMTEQEYLSHREAFNRELMQWGLNPSLFKERHANLVSGDVSAAEIHERLGSVITGIVQQKIPAFREKYGEYFGINAMSDEALIGMHLDPKIGQDVLQGRILAAQVGGEAALQGFQRDRNRAELLVFSGGLNQQAARQLFSQAAQAVPRFGRFAERFNDPFGEFTVDQFEDATVFGDSDEQRRMRRLQASEQSLFNRGGQVRRDNMGLSGLRAL